MAGKLVVKNKNYLSNRGAECILEAGLLKKMLILLLFFRKCVWGKAPQPKIPLGTLHFDVVVESFVANL